MPLTVLVVDDTDDPRADMVKEIRRITFDCLVFSVNTQQAAEELISRMSLDVIICDINFSNVPGGRIDTGREIGEKAAQTGQKHNVIYVTSYKDLTHFLTQDARVVVRDSKYLEALAAKTKQVIAASVGGGISTSRRLTIDLTKDPSGRLSFQLDEGSWQMTETCLVLDIPVLKESAAGIGLLFGSDSRREQGSLAKLIGTVLYHCIFFDHKELLTALQHAQGPDKCPVTIRVENPNDVLGVPLELLFDGSEFLAMQHPLVRSLKSSRASSRSAAELATKPELRVLLLASDTCSPNLGGIPLVDDEIDRIGEVLKELAFVKVTARKSWECTLEVARSLLHEEWDVIHFAGHGVYDSVSPDESRLLFWEKPGHLDCWPLLRGYHELASRLRGRVEALTSSELARCLQDHPPVLVYLSCCHSARHSDTASLAWSESLGLMDAVVRLSGAPVVIGHRWPVADNDKCLRFVGTFYHQLAARNSPEQALLKARRAVSTSIPTWASPVMVTSGGPSTAVRQDRS